MAVIRGVPTVRRRRHTTSERDWGSVVCSAVLLPRLQLAKALSVSWLKLTVPLGAVADVGVLSVTVAVQLLGLPTGTDAGAQRTTVLVTCWRAVTTTVTELLRRLVSPP